MPELVDAEALAMVEESRSAALAWRALVGWVGIVLQIVVQVFRFSPSSWSQILSFIGFRDHPFLSSSTFKPLPSDTPAFAPAASSATAVEALEKLTIVLDLDETLVCAYEAYSLPDMVEIRRLRLV
ncbi:hypothetical protein HPP92_019005 [Vanilla planifolia]|uniref:FCP1 homology domain-containing protein n=1 Tax=Vanilla planifolia TaxID=51239 RepID=A0A835UNX1_VANPL|nr:hypothetical protein HPP92_019005 [Vanilla planifolia]